MGFNHPIQGGFLCRNGFEQKPGPWAHMFTWASQGNSPELAVSNLGVSENSVPLHPMVNDHYPH